MTRGYGILADTFPGLRETRSKGVPMTRYPPDMLISDVLASDPHAARVFTSLGLGCPSCLGAGMDTLSSVANMHDVPLETLLEALDSLDTTPSSTEETP